MCRRNKERLRLSALLIACAVGCQQEMANQPRYDPLEPSVFFDDRQSSRQLVPGTVVRDGVIVNAGPMDRVMQTGMENGEVVDALPASLTEDRGLRDVLLRGRQRFRIYCAPCHGLAGEGDGMVVRRGFPSPPTYHSDRLRGKPLGHFYIVATNGLGKMPSYADQISTEDRWAIAAYVRALQFSQHAPASLLEEQDLKKLEHGERGASAP
ncbi:MAG: c-type cytochrome [Planctomycetaceae bacterium]